MLSRWRARKDDQSPMSPTKTGRDSKGAMSFSVSNEPSVLSPSLTSSKKPSTSSGTKEAKHSDTRLNNNLLPPDRVSTLSGKDFVVILVEIFMAYSNYVIRRRKTEAHSYKSQLWKTRREIEIDLLFMQGWASLGSLLAGVLADGFIGNFYVALSSIVAIFLMATGLYLEQLLIERVKTNPYAEIITEVASVAHLFNNSTGFSRVVFGLENMKNKKPSSVSLLLFIFVAVGEIPVSGGLLMAIAKGARLNTLSLVRVCWWSSGISVVLFVTFFKSIAVEKSYRAASRRAIKCMLDGFWHLCVGRCFKKDWKDHMHRHYDKLTLGRAKGCLNYMVLLLSIAGYIFFTVGKAENLFYRVGELINPVGIHYYLGFTPVWASCVILTMVVTYFLVIPGLTYIGYPKQFHYHFSLGHLFAIMSMYYLALVLQANDKYDYDSGIGYVRIYNARNSEVALVPQESHETSRNLSITVPSHGAVMWSYVLREEAEMFRMMLKFDDLSNFTIYMRAEATKCVSYAITDPPEMIRVTANIPLFEGPPTTNDYSKARIYLFNAARAFNKRTIRFRDLTTGEWIMKLVSLLGRTDIFQVPPGKYEVWVEGTELHLHHKFNDGGLYGIMLLADIATNLLELDTVIPQKEVPSTVMNGFTIFYGLALTLAYVPLHIMTYTKAPNGLLNTCFGFLSAQQNLAVWILVLGFYTWHEQILGNTLLVYCFILTFLFFISVFIMIKYNQFFA